MHPIQTSDLLKAVRHRSGFRQNSVAYVKLGKARKKPLATTELPFVKRFAFAHESEFRIIYESESDREPKPLDVPIPLSSIAKVTLSPWLQPPLFHDVKKMLQSIKGCSGLHIQRSTLISNAEWKALGDGSS